MTRIEDSDWPERVLDFWLGELTPRDWFAKSDDLDRQITDRFEELLKGMVGPPPFAFPIDIDDDPDRNAALGLAAIIVLDQFSRNVYRDDPLSFASDHLALAIARQMVAHGFDQRTDPPARVFVYLPFEHSEDLADQDTSVELIKALGDDQFTRYAHAHRDAIKRFGRFPHRNAILHRPSTSEEEAYLSQPGSGF